MSWNSIVISSILGLYVIAVAVVIINNMNAWCSYLRPTVSLVYNRNVQNHEDTGWTCLVSIGVNFRTTELSLLRKMMCDDSPVVTFRVVFFLGVFTKFLASWGIYDVSDEKIECFRNLLLP